ncbi:MAG: hypothetical protein HYU66_11865, partial [Armatimonadetes bacterium]|nr:hypothetical protein [Armatimonadota bacterium]
ERSTFDIVNVVRRMGTQIPDATVRPQVSSPMGGGGGGFGGGGGGFGGGGGGFGGGGRGGGGFGR